MIETQAMIAEDLIYAALINRTAAEYIAGKLSPDDFLYAEHRGMMSNICEAVGQGKPVSPPTVIAGVQGGAEAVESIISRGLSSDNYEVYVEAAKAIAAKQKLSRLAAEITQLSNDEKTDLTEILAKIETGLASVHGVKTNEPVKVKTAAKEWLETMRERMERGVMRGISTGFTHLDEMLGGLQGQRLYVLAGRPGSGKSVFALSIAKNVAEQGKKVLFVSLEMGRIEVIDRVIADYSGIYLNNIESGFSGLKSAAEKGRQLERIKKGVARLISTDITIWDETNISVSDIALECQRLKRTEGVDLIIVDYLGLLDKDTSNNEVKELGLMSRRLKNLAAELDTPVIALHQVNRSCENRENKRPNKSDLRGSGEIEENANVVMLTYREDYYEKNHTKHTGDMEIIVDKNRSGACGTAMLTTDLSHMRISDKLTPFDNLGEQS